MDLKPGHRDDLLELADTLGDVSWQLELLAGRIGTPELISIANLIEAAGNALCQLAAKPRPTAWGPKPDPTALGVARDGRGARLRAAVHLPPGIGGVVLAHLIEADERDYASR